MYTTFHDFKTFCDSCTLLPAQTHALGGGRLNTRSPVEARHLHVLSSQDYDTVMQSECYRYTFTVLIGSIITVHVNNLLVISLCFTSFCKGC